MLRASETRFNKSIAYTSCARSNASELNRSMYRRKVHFPPVRISRHMISRLACQDNYHVLTATQYNVALSVL